MSEHREQVASFGYPRPQLEREGWVDLNGVWEFAIDAEAQWRQPEDVIFDRSIVVPFAPETPASGIHDQGYYLAVWYRRQVKVQKLGECERVILHFGAVDTSATVWVNGQRVVEHEGGYTPFWADVTQQVGGGEADTMEIVVRAYDDPHDLGKPRGKQDWMPRPHVIWYPRTTGIWQSVWMEVVNEQRIETIRWFADVKRWELDLDVTVAGFSGRLISGEGLSLAVKLSCEGQPVAEDTWALSAGSRRSERGSVRVRRSIGLADSSDYDVRAKLLWSPTSPRLIEAELVLKDGSGAVVDVVKSYTAMRSVGAKEGQMLLNERPFKPMMLLDQGYWPESGLTAPDDAAYRRDVELAKAMGFDGVRKHQKIESPRFLYWADKLGLLVWEEMPSAYRYDERSMRLLASQWMEAIERDISHPCIVTWVPLNESWGVPDIASDERQRDAARSLYYLTRALDGSRLISGNDGWEMPVSDIVGIHDYARDPQVLVKRYGQPQERVEDILARERPATKPLLLEGFELDGQPIMLTEFGGIALHKDAQNTWGYTRVASGEELAAQYAYLVAGVRAVDRFWGYCYTQFTDTYQEANGLLYMDRSPKFPLEQIAIATRGARNAEEAAVAKRWYEQVRDKLKQQKGGSLGQLARGECDDR